ncbi:hypothetical protein Bca4012_018174 [Brassica carinata]
MAGVGPLTQDWEPVVIRKKAPNSAAKRDEKTVNAARRSGADIESVRKYNAGTNKPASSGTSLNTKRLDDDTENLSHERVPTELKKAIMQARTDKKLTQSQLAQLINEKPQVIQEYESGKAIPNQQILSKLERALGAKLREPSKINDSGLHEGVEAFLQDECDNKYTTKWDELLDVSLVAIECFRGTPYLEAMIDRRTKDGSVLVKKWLQEALRRENISVNVRSGPGYATKAELQNFKRRIINEKQDGLSGNLKCLNGLTEELESILNRLKSDDTKETPSGDQLDIDALDDDPWGKWGDEEEQEDDDNCKADKSYDDMQLKLDLRDRVDSLFRFLNKIIESKNKESIYH